MTLGKLAEGVSKRALPKHAMYITLEVAGGSAEGGGDLNLPCACGGGEWVGGVSSPLCRAFTYPLPSLHQTCGTS